MITAIDLSSAKIYLSTKKHVSIDFNHADIAQRYLNGFIWSIMKKNNVCKGELSVVIKDVIC